MNALFFWLIPPLVGALIGYVTNAVAIKMLFRPHKEIRLLGIRLPFTPGIMPRQRHKLADSIGSMVERKLLTTEVVRARLRREDTREETRKAISAYTGKLLDTPLEKLSADKNGLFLFITEFARDFTRTPAFDAILDRFLVSILEEIPDGESPTGSLRTRSIREILGPEDAEKFTAALELLIRRGIRSAAAGIPQQMIPVFDRTFPLLTETFFRFLRGPEIHETLEAQGRIFLNNAILKLNVLQRFFITAGQYNRTLQERMPEIIDDLIGQLEQLTGERETRERIRSLTLTSIQGILLAEGSSAGSSAESSAFISRMIDSALDRPLGDLLANTDRDSLRRLLRRAVFFLTESGGGAREGVFGRAFRGFIEDHRGMTLGELLSTRTERKDRLDTLLSEKLLVLADAQVNAVLGTIKVRTLVSERIDSLNMIDVERIILDVVANQLKWINLFGGILGALIGLFQSLFSWLSRGL
jgi:hypothetical protein